MLLTKTINTYCIDQNSLLKFVTNFCIYKIILHVFFCLCNYYNIYYKDLPFWWLDKRLTSPNCKKPACYEMLCRASELVSSCEHGNEPSGSVKGREFLD